MRRVAAGCGLVAILLVGLAAGIGWCFHQAKSDRLEKEDAAINDRSPVRPPFLRDALACGPNSRAAERLDEAMLQVARTAAVLDPRILNPALQDAISYFAWHWSIVGNGDKRRCPPDQTIIDEIAPLLDAAGWPAVNSHRLDLRLAERLPADAIRARGLAAIAFNRYPPPQDLKFYDSRPLAMQLLADQGRFALPWSRAAIGRMEADSAIGTGAAQVGVATDPARALPLLSKLMAGKLKLAKRVSAYSNGGESEAIEGRDANRLIELGYAMARGGALARPYAGPVIAMLDVRIARASPPFGLFATPPTEFCRIARAIGGNVAASANRRDFCAPGFRGGDGGPSPY